METENELTEYHDEPAALQESVKILADLVRNSKYLVAFTGAGISHSSGIETYRGPNGFWTRRDQGLPPPKSLALEKALPNIGHMTLVGLKNYDILKHLVSTNVDGLHRRSGFGADEMSELHGNCYKEHCTVCGREFMRTFKVSTPKAVAHLTGRNCDCGAPLIDSIINFGENLPQFELNKADYHSSLGDLALVLGTSMKVTPACDIPERIWGKDPEGAGKMVIVNLQKTKYDHMAFLRIFGETDVVLTSLMAELGLEIPAFEEKSMI